MREAVLSANSHLETAVSRRAFHAEWDALKAERDEVRAGWIASGLIGTGLARLAGVSRPRIRWRVTDGPWLRNMLTALEFDGRAGRIRFDQTVSEVTGLPVLQPRRGEAQLTGPGGRNSAARDN
jgi:hypothetical protein